MDFLCYLHKGWQPLIRPAEPTRAWMDATPEAFAYRCLPLNIANAHGWEILTPVGFEAYWRGGASTADVIIRADDGMPSASAPVSLFGQATFTIHIQALFRTPPGWNLMVGGSPNWAKEGVAALSGVIETDWSPYTFTMNWRFLRRNHWVRFEAGDPICFIQPTERDALERMNPKFVALEDDPEAASQFAAWSKSRNEFQAAVAQRPPSSPADQWQKRYYRGLNMHDRAGVEDHRAKLRLKPFVTAAPDAAKWQTVRIDPDRLEAAIALLAASVRDGRLLDGDPPIDAGPLIDAGIPAALAERLVRAVRGGCGRTGQAGGSTPGSTLGVP
ncbi:DUF6065 family protein [Rhodopila sp.]|uniref:DUF6065 family protein n=1 Tax=Rhodopila sp. TaxID=2480087 RepID=UPI003D1204D0